MKQGGVMKKSKTIKTIILGISLGICFIYSQIFSYSDKVFFQGHVVYIEDDRVWVRTSSILSEEDTLLYVHGQDQESKSILQVLSISPFYVETEIVEGDSIEIGDAVRGVYRWDAFQYLTEFLYEKGEGTVRVQRNLIFPVQWSAVDSLGERRSFFTEEIERFEVAWSKNGFYVNEVVLKNRERVSLSNFRLNSLDTYWDKTVQLESDPENSVQLSGKNLNQVILIKRIRGAYRQLTASLDQQPFTPLGKQYLVKFNFLDYRLGISAIERKIIEEIDPDRKLQWIEFLKSYNESQILGVGLSGSFNDWDFTQNPLTRNDYGFYETNVVLEGGSYQYYFVIRVRGLDGEEIHLNVLDPSVPLTEDLLASKTKTKALAYLLPGQSSSEDKIEETIEDTEEIGVDGKASLIEIPSVVPILEQTDIGITEEDESDSSISTITENELPFHLRELEKEESSLATSWIEGDILVDGDPYFRVQFQFDFLYRVRTQIKRQINTETRKGNPDPQKTDQLYLLLRLYSEKRVRNVYISGTFNNWERTPLNKNSDNSWSLEKYVPAGKHLYHYLIETGLTDYPYYSIPNLYSKNREENESGVESSILNLDFAEEEELEDSEDISDEK